MTKFEYEKDRRKRMVAKQGSDRVKDDAKKFAALLARNEAARNARIRKQKAEERNRARIRARPLPDAAELIARMQAQQARRRRRLSPE